LIDGTVADPDKMALTTFAVLTIAEVYAMIGRVDLALRLAETSLKRARDTGERIWEAQALHLLGEAHECRAVPDLAAAEAHQHAARAMAKELGMRPLAARCQLALARMHGRRGDRAAAHRWLLVARGEFEALELPYWVSRTLEFEAAWAVRVTG
jgi:hypothetical protein